MSILADVTEDWIPRQKEALDRAIKKLHEDSKPPPILTSEINGVRHNPARKVWEVRRKCGKKYILQLTLPTKGQAEALVKGFDLGVERGRGLK
jgi:hypothetical protein